MKDKIEDIEDTKIEKYKQSIGEKEYNFGDKLNSANPFILHQNKHSEKFLIGLEIINILGANNIFNKNTFKIDFGKIVNYLTEREYNIRLLFKCKKLDLPNSQNKEKDTLKYINARLRSLFNINIKKVDNKSDDYSIDNLNFWNDKINPFKEDIKLKEELTIKALIDNLFNNSD